MPSLRIEAMSKQLLAVLVCGLMWSATGCSTTPQDKLHGRWYNSKMSIRFRTDGTVIFNSMDGLATGRYTIKIVPDRSGAFMSELRNGNSPYCRDK